MKPLPLKDVEDFIFTIEKMLEKERGHCQFLKSHQGDIDSVDDAFLDMIIESNRMINHLTYRLSEYKHYAYTHYGNDALKE